MLPNDLDGAVQALDDEAFRRLRDVVEREARRRMPEVSAEPTLAREVAAPDKVGDTRGMAGAIAPAKMRLIRAAAEAGIKPHAIAKQFGFPIAMVRNAISKS